MLVVSIPCRVTKWDAIEWYVRVCKQERDDATTKKREVAICQESTMTLREEKARGCWLSLPS